MGASRSTVQTLAHQILSMYNTLKWKEKTPALFEAIPHFPAIFTRSLLSGTIPEGWICGLGCGVPRSVPTLGTQYAPNPSWIG